MDKYHVTHEKHGERNTVRCETLTFAMIVAEALAQKLYPDTICVEDHEKHEVYEFVAEMRKVGTFPLCNNVRP